MNIGIIGFGNLGRALASGLIKSGCVGAGAAGSGSLYVCEVEPGARAAAENAPYNARVSDDANDAISGSDAVFLTVKGYVFDKLSTSIDRNLLKGKTVISFMAGEKFEKLRPQIGDAILVRAMPSLAIAACDGVIGYTSAPREISEIFHKLGYAFETAPEDIEKVMAFSSCGLGFAAYLIDAFASAGGAMGFPPETCARIAAQTFKNAVERGDFRETVGAVATPGGATERGIAHMGDCGVYDIVAQAVRKAYEKMV